MTVEFFVRLVWSFCKNQKKVEKRLFYGHFWVNFGCFSHNRAIRFWCHCTYRTLIWCRMAAENFVRIVWSFRENQKMSFLAIFGLILAVSHIPAIRFWCHCTYRTLIWCRMTVENFVRIVWTVFEKIEKSRKMAVFGHFWLFLTFQSYDFDAFEHAGAPLGVEWLCKILWKSYGVFEKFEIFMKRSEEKTTRLNE